MTEIGEAVAIAIDASQNDDDECWFCEEEPGESLENDEVARPDTSDDEDADGVPENDEGNDASALGSNLVGAGKKVPDWRITKPNSNAKTRVLPAAHHLIPGNASLAKAEALHDFMRKGGPFNLSSDIGYDVNDAKNGEWMPGNYGVRPGKEDYTAKWSSFKKSFKDLYAKRAMEKARKQFHDAHPKYNKQALRTLDALAQKLGDPETHCPICGEEYDSTRPPYGLVGRLHAISDQHRQRITKLSRRGRKHVQNGYYTSSRVKAYFGL